VPKEGEQSPTGELIEAAFEDTEADYLTGLAEAVTGALAALDAVQVFLEGRVETMSVPSFAPIRGVLLEVQGALNVRLERRGYAVTSDGDDAGDAAPAGGVPAAAPAAGEIRSSQDVTRHLDRLIEYYVRNEPSSPVPLLLRRAQRLVSRSFMDIVRDLSPDGLEQIRLISGEREEEVD
jgi:type VI secretion system protein ImpA